MRIARLLVLLAGTITVVATSTSNAAVVTLTPFGEPTWVSAPTWGPVDIHVFSGPTGTAPDYAELFQTVGALLPPPNHLSDPVVGIVPGIAHAPPYDQELEDGVRNLGFVEKSVFGVSEFSSGNGVYLVWMNVPRAGSPFGSSPDSLSGPIIPNSLFPIEFSGFTYRNGVQFSAENIIPTEALPLVDGYSHFPSFFVENFDFALDPAAGPIGAYEIVLQLTDFQGNGWEVAAPFEVVPEPGTLGMLAIGVIGLVVWRRHRPWVSARVTKLAVASSGPRFRAKQPQH